jgi:hypothetical protein
VAEDPAQAIAELERRMAEAAAADDFEAAARLRDELRRLRDGSRLEEQVPGKMGLGTSRETYVRPEGWTPPAKPDPMTSRTGRGGRRRR